ncbi:MAG: methionyl-tRNA formyltransferase [Acidiferrobacterales bacterium]
MNIVFAGTPAFAVPPLRALHDSDRYRLRAVYTQPDRPAGRGRRPRSSAVKQFALDMGLPVYQPERLTPDVVSALADLQPDLLVVAAYGLILPKALLELADYGCINVHASLLPRWRGGAPIPRAIEAGDRATGITIMQMDEGLDTGDILAQTELNIQEDDNAQTLHDRLTEVGADLLLATLERLIQGEVKPQPQDEAKACYAPKVRKQEGKLDWTEPAVTLHRKIRAFNPWPVAHTRFRDRLVRLWVPGVVETATPTEEIAPGTVVAAQPDAICVMTGDGILPIRRLQLEGGKPMAADAFINGQHVRPGEQLL